MELLATLHFYGSGTKTSLQFVVDMGNSDCEFLGFRGFSRAMPTLKAATSS